MGCSCQPGATLDDLREAVATLEDAERIARRVFGVAHPLTEGIEVTSQASARAALRARETPSPGNTKTWTIYIITRRRLGPRHRDLRVQRRRPSSFFSKAWMVLSRAPSRRPRAGRRVSSSRLSRDPYSICGQFINVEPRRSQDFGDLIHDARSIVARAPYSSFAHRPRMGTRLDLARRHVQATQVLGRPFTEQQIRPQNATPTSCL